MNLVSRTGLLSAGNAFPCTTAVQGSTGTEGHPGMLVAAPGTWSSGTVMAQEVKAGWKWVQSSSAGAQPRFQCLSPSTC